MVCVYLHLRRVTQKDQFCQKTVRIYLYLTLSQTTNFGLFQTERVCRRQFQILRKWQKVIQTGRKHCGKRRNCSLRAISPFPQCFKRLVSQGRQKVSLCGNGLKRVTQKDQFLSESGSYISILTTSDTKGPFFCLKMVCIYLYSRRVTQNDQFCQKTVHIGIYT